MKCTNCGTKFTPTTKQRRKMCKPCVRKYNNDYYANNEKRRKDIRKAARLRVESNLAEVQEYKTAEGCKFCGESEPVCLDFHHLDPAQKDATVSRLVTHGHPMTRVWEEIEKCIVVCSNCHRKVHAGLIPL